MNAKADEPATIRRARAEDVEPILDLLAHYDAPRSYFEPFYLSDPSYRPEHSWVADQEGRLVAHLRVYDRPVRVGGARLRVGGIGNVITAPDQRGRGHAGRLLEAMLEEIPAEGFAYSLLRAYQPVLYERYGWAPVDQELVRAALPPIHAVPITPFKDADLPDVMRLYDETNVGRSGTTIRSPEYWRSQLEWLREDRDGFLLSRTGDGKLAGYVRSRAGETDVEILELGLRAGDVETGRALLSAAARHGGRLQAFLPPSLRTLFRPGEGEIISEFGLMGRVINLAALVAALEPAWLGRARESGGRGGFFDLATSVGHARVTVGTDGIRISKGADEGALDEREFAHLLLRGFDDAASEWLGARPDSSLLRVLFPAQDFVVWRADAF